DRDWEGDPLEQVVGAYRLLRGSVARRSCGFYGAGEYDLSLLAGKSDDTVELGRSCVAAEHRGGAAMLLLWNGLAEYVMKHKIRIMFGVASFHGTDPDEFSEALSFLYHHHLAPPELRVRALARHYVAMDRMPAEDVDEVRAMRTTPALIKSYIRLGGFVGDGAFVDNGFNTVDVCLIMDTRRMSAKYRDFYTRGAA
ncbi:MAG: GNAT family N-acetyltransferase, partial [Paracoccaceae bacterium]